jgi:hypothetical protein
MIYSISECVWLPVWHGFDAPWADPQFVLQTWTARLPPARSASIH